MAKIHVLKSVQKIPVSLEQAWSFFSDAGNLLTITPPFLNLKITNKQPRTEMYPGQIITYKVKPLLGIPVFWMTEITHVEPLKLFVDEQRKGPYTLWHHQHHFASIPGGVEMTDIVHYGLPLGVAGRLAHLLTVKQQLKKIFTYRYFKVNELFGDWPGESLHLEME
ncbi:SRPBCC family protein [Paraflavisolibacter sp. H34]|uniref:SRPBCC family protein n=1 Tax=Huijunlia imazamoxiresistens TaxID=3127457 RepID=UPI0030169AD5